MIEHTSGPWTYDGEWVNGKVNQQTTRVCRVRQPTSSPGSITEQRADANGPILAASLDLLEACKAMLTHLTAFTRNYRTREECDMLNQARAALDKAKPPKGEVMDAERIIMDLRNLLAEHREQKDAASATDRHQTMTSRFLHMVCGHQPSDVEVQYVCNSGPYPCGMGHGDYGITASDSGE